MKKLCSFLAVLALLITACNAPVNDKGFTINAQIDGLSDTKVFLQEYTEGEMITIDSAESVDGHFVMEGTLDAPKFLYLFLGQQGRAQFFVENAPIELAGTIEDIENININGSSAQDVYQSYLELVRPYEEQKSELIKQWRTATKDNDTVKLKEIDVVYSEADSIQSVLVETFIDENPASVVSPYLVRSKLIYNLDRDELQAYIDAFSEEISAHPYVEVLRDRSAKLETVAVGKQAPDFTMADNEGGEITLSDLQGNVLLVDFWASWCSPCRAENPNVVAAYQKYHDKGFDILGVSLDNDRDKWLAAIEADNLGWHHVSDLKGWKNAASRMYGVMSIPHSVLLDKDGKIIAHNLRGEELHEKLEEIFSSDK